MRLESTKPAMLFFPLACVAYGWLAEKRANIATICVALFFAGFFSMCVLLLLLAPHFLSVFPLTYIVRLLYAVGSIQALLHISLMPIMADRHRRLQLIVHSAVLLPSSLPRLQSHSRSVSDSTPSLFIASLVHAH